MGLSERKVKQRIGNDPRNLQWRQDTTSFGAQYLLKAGHVPNTSLGLTADSGLINPIAVARKLDNSGIGVGRSRKEGGTDNGGVGGAGSGLDALLKRLAAESGTASPDGSASPSGEDQQAGAKVMSGFQRAVGNGGVVDTVVVQSTSNEDSESKVEQVKVVARPNRLAHRAKFRNAKSQASVSATTAMNEILGIKSLPTSSAPSPTSSSVPGTPIADDLIVQNKDQMSVGDYFKAKMEAKKAAMMKAIADAAAASGNGENSQSLEVSVGDGVVFDEVVKVGGDASEEEITSPEESRAVSEETTPVEEEKKSAEKKGKKEKKDKKTKEKKRKREDTEGTVDAVVPSAPTATVVEDASESEEARTKREKKEDKRRKKEASVAGKEENDGKNESEDSKKKKKKRKTSEE
ncbi:Telomerase elongation inhibitor/RNA maturation protein PINX1 [Phaffia rhodozyma]|uniref:PinX1-related protein 1 n=1 Tax=Phaffia rhodozyma TaxID=264483 RepID=A0A0F7SSI7_PHARH|nr:Telomerase elongation inhibitor/RNA maturation protein PINX1 [Phaffia rhodozyma]